MHRYVFLPIMVLDMPIVSYIIMLATNGIPGGALAKTYKHKMVGVVGFLLAASFAPTSTVL